MFEPAKIAEAFLTESRIDLMSAKLLFDKGIIAEPCILPSNLQRKR